jgi:hypothetical protein
LKKIFKLRLHRTSEIHARWRYRKNERCICFATRTARIVIDIALNAGPKVSSSANRKLNHSADVPELPHYRSWRPGFINVAAASPKLEGSPELIRRLLCCLFHSRCLNFNLEQSISSMAHEYCRTLILSSWYDIFSRECSSIIIIIILILTTISSHSPRVEIEIAAKHDASRDQTAPPRCLFASQPQRRANVLPGEMRNVHEDPFDTSTVQRRSTRVSAMSEGDALMLHSPT